MDTCWVFVVFVDVTEDKFVGVFTEWIPEDGHGVEVHVRVGPFRLVCTRSIVIPHGTIWKQNLDLVGFKVNILNLSQ